jgi:hypothetical protein
MEIKFRGEMTIADVRQALFEQPHDLETNYSAKFSRGATLYIQPTNGFGDDVIPRVAGGRPLMKLYSMGPYRSAAHISLEGHVCFVLPHGLLFNHGKTAVSFQKAWVSQNTIRRVLNQETAKAALIRVAAHDEGKGEPVDDAIRTLQ